MLKPWVIGLLSTDYDLHDYREAVTKELREHSSIVISAFELPDFPVEPDEHSHDSCLTALDRTDIVILVIDKRYGGIYYNSSDVSITEEEYLTALRKGKPCLVFVSQKTWDERYTYCNHFKASGKSESDFDKTYPCTYVQNANTIHFVDHIQKVYELNGTSNWITFFDGIPDLLAKIQGKLKGLSRFFAQKIVEVQAKELSDRHTSTSFSMNLGDVFRKGYYIEPVYTIDSGELCLAGETLDKRIVETLINSLSILVFGEAGYGKTTILAKSFLLHAETFISGKTYHIPFYLWLKKKNNAYHFDFTAYMNECFEENLHKFSYPFIDLSGINPYFYLDGFDEIAEKLTSEEVDKIGSSDIFQYPMLLTCRLQYAFRYLNNYNFSDKFSSRVKVETWNIDKAKTYIDNFCRVQGKDSNYSQGIHKLLADNQELMNILNNPLLVTMLLWIIEVRRMTVPETIRSRVELFTECIDEMAKRELFRTKNQALSENDVVQIWSYSAWLFYKNKILGIQTKISILLNELQETLLKGLGNDYNESLFESLFDTSNDKIYGTFHEQFLEYLVANTIFTACVDGMYPYPEFLEYVMRPEINRYFRAMWSESKIKEQKIVIGNLNRQYLDNLGDDSDKAVAKRVHAIYHISRFNTDSQKDMIDKAFKIETHISVRLSLFFGAIKMGRLDDEESFYELLTSSQDYNIANRGYHLAYYSDAIKSNHLPFVDDCKVSWQGTLRAFLRHFESKDIEHYYLRRIDLITMLHLIEARNSIEPLTQDLLDHFSKLTYNPPFSVNTNFQKGIEEALDKVKAVYVKISEQGNLMENKGLDQ